MRSPSSANRPSAVMARSATTKQSRRLALVAALLLATIACIACNGSGGGGTPTDPGGSTSLALTATPTSIAVGGQSRIVALVTATGGAARSGLRIALSTN